MQKTLDFFKEGASKAYDYVFGTHSAFEYAKIGGMFLLQPANTTFKYILYKFLPRLKSPTKCERVELGESKLKLYSLLAKLSREVYHTEEENFKEMIPKSTKVIKVVGENSIDKVPYMIVYDEELKCLIFTIRGSYTFGDFITDLKASATDVDGILVHSGVFSASNSLFVRSEAYLLDLVKEKENCPIIFTGHSLGAGVAAITAKLFLQSHPDLSISAVCFAPVACLSADALEETNSYITSFIVQGDPIPFLSLHNMAQISDTGYKMINNVIEEAVLRDISRPISVPDGFDMNANPFEAEPPTMEKIKDDLKFACKRSTALFPPGKCYQIAVEGDTYMHAFCEDIQDSTEFFNGFRNNANIDRHAMKFYMDSVNELLRNCKGSSS